MNDIYKPVTGIISRDEYQKGTTQVKALTDLKNTLLPWLKPFSTFHFGTLNYCSSEQDRNKY